MKQPELEITDLNGKSIGKKNVRNVNMELKEYLIINALLEEKELEESRKNKIFDAIFERSFKKDKYISPDIEVEEIVVEKGFAGSHGHGHAHGKAGKWDEIETVDEWD